jgi:hypothetical protein
VDSALILKRLLAHDRGNYLPLLSSLSEAELMQ